MLSERAAADLNMVPPPSPPQPPHNTRTRRKRGRVAATDRQPIVGFGTAGTPPPEEDYWMDTNKEWDKDDMGGKFRTSTDYLIEWLEDTWNHDFWKGQHGGTGQRGAVAFRKYLYENKGPTRRSSQSIYRKVCCAHRSLSLYLADSTTPSTASCGQSGRMQMRGSMVLA